NERGAELPRGARGNFARRPIRSSFRIRSARAALLADHLSARGLDRDRIARTRFSLCPPDDPRLRAHSCSERGLQGPRMAQTGIAPRAMHLGRDVKRHGAATTFSRRNYSHTLVFYSLE